MGIDVAVVVSTCDKYRVLWEPFCHGFRKYWPDCQWPVRWVANHLDAPLGVTVRVGDDVDWSRTSILALQAIDAEVVLWIHEDNWLAGQVDNGVLVSLVRLFGDHADLNAIRLSNCYMSTVGGLYRHDKRLCTIRPDSVQRCSLQPSFWRRTALLALLRPGESPWVFEGEAPLRARNEPGDHCCCREGFYPLRFLSHVDPGGWGGEAMRRGKWTEAARKYAAREGLEIDFSTNPDGTPAT